MVSAADIKDRDSLEAWLQDQPRETAIAPRAALRVMPVWAEFSETEAARERDLTPLSVLRSGLISSVAAVSPTDEIRSAAAAAAAYGNASADAASAASADAASTASAASAYAASAYTTSAASAVFAAYAAYYSTSSADAFSAAVWSAVRRDAEGIASGDDPLALPLWPGENPLQEEWDSTRARWPPGSPYDFWRRWYDSLLDGTPMNPDLLYKIATEIPNETWDAGPEAVAAAIREIEAETADDAEIDTQIEALVRDNPHAWRVELDEKTVKLAASAVEKRDLSEIVAGTRQTLKDFTARCRADTSPNKMGEQMLAALGLPIKDLRRDLKRYATQPLSLMKCIEDARKEVVGIAHREHFATESSVVRLGGSLASHAEDICVASPEVVEQLKRKNQVRYELATAEKRDLATRAAFGLHLDSEGLLKASAFEAVRVLQDEDASPEAKKEAWYFVTAVLPRAVQTCRANPETVEKGKKKSAGQRVIDAADAANKLDKGVDALQENIPEAFDWLAWVTSEVMSGNYFGLGG